VLSNGVKFAMLLNPFTFHVPKTLPELLQLYTGLENVKLQAGGTFLLNSLKLFKRKGAKTPDHIISLRKVEGLRGLSADEHQLIIKSMTTISEIFESSLLDDNFKVLKTVCRNISTNPIRNMATLGGNLTCRYTWTEMPATMIGLEANLHFIDSTGQEHVVTAEEFFKNAAKTDKILTHITIKREAKASIAYRRVKKSSYVDIPLLSVFIKTNFDGDRFTNSRVSVNNCVAFAQRDRVLEEFLNQSRCSQKLAQEALDHLDKTIYDTRSNDYKKQMFRVSIKNAINDLIEQPGSF
jgi:aerobic carbon-monoxide dehydrogenase medium subunit